MPTSRSPIAMRRRPGPQSLFRDKIRAPVSITLTAAHHLKVRRAMRRVGLTRADVLGLLIHLHADALSQEDVRRVADGRS